MLLLELVFDVGTSLRDLLNQFSHVSDASESVLEVLVDVTTLVLLFDAVGLVVELVEKSQERMRAVGSGLPAVSV